MKLSLTNLRTLKDGYCASSDDSTCAQESYSDHPFLIQQVSDLEPSGTSIISLWWQGLSVWPEISPGCSIMFTGDGLVEDATPISIAAFDGPTDDWAFSSVPYTMPSDVDASGAFITIFLSCGDETNSQGITGEVMIDQVALIPN
jgi:hypothetical protein